MSESYKFWDTLFQRPNDSAFYKFEGYEIYEIKKSANTLPDLSKPETINDDIKLMVLYDKVDTVGVLIDTFVTGTTPSGQEQL